MAGCIICLVLNISKSKLTFDPYCYRTTTGAEIDLIIESAKGILPIEIKFTQKIDIRDLRGLKDFIKGRNCPIGWVIHNGECVEWLDEKNIRCTRHLFMIYLLKSELKKFLKNFSERKLIVRGEIR